MGISNNYNELSEEFEIFGLKDRKWEVFQLKKNYEAFLVRRRQFKFVVMSTKAKNKKSTAKSKKGVDTISPKVRNYGDHPFFVKKAKEAKALIDEVGLPEFERK